MEGSDVQYNNAKRELDAWLSKAKHELDVQYNVAKQEVDDAYDEAKGELNVHYYAAKHKLILGYLNANCEGNSTDKESLELSLENAWLPSFVDDYIDHTRIRADLKIITADGQVTLAHKHMVPCNYGAKFAIMERNGKMYIMEDFVNKEALLLILQLLYLDECVAGPRMEKYGPKVMVASSLFTLTSKDLIVSAMKDSITLQNCGDVAVAIDICRAKYNDTFYNHDSRGLAKMCANFLQRNATKH
jgi:hypothetical protein